MPVLQHARVIIRKVSSKTHKWNPKCHTSIAIDIIIPNPANSTTLFSRLCAFKNHKFSMPITSAAIAAIALRVSMTKALVETSCRTYAIPSIPVPMATSSKKDLLSTALDRFL